MRVTQAEFITGAVSPSGYPAGDLPEVAFVGRSNVGKSTLINALLQRKRLARTSGTPGKTREINFYLVNGRFHVVDLPGYGFARVPAAEKAKWKERIEAYLTGRKQLKLVVALVDVRHPPSALDRQMVTWLAHYGRPCRVVATKADKLSRGQVPQALAAIARDLGHHPLAVSAERNRGLSELWRVVQEALVAQP